MKAKLLGQPLTIVHCTVKLAGQREIPLTIGDIAEGKLGGILELRGCGSWKRNDNSKAEPGSLVVRNLDGDSEGRKPTECSERHRHFVNGQELWFQGSI